MAADELLCMSTFFVTLCDGGTLVSCLVQHVDEQSFINSSGMWRLRNRGSQYNNILYVIYVLYNILYSHYSPGPGRVRSRTLCVRSFSSLLASAKSLRGGPDPQAFPGTSKDIPGPPWGLPGDIQELSLGIKVTPGLSNGWKCHKKTMVFQSS